MNYKAIVVIDSCEHEDNPVQKVILVPENAAASILKKVEARILDEGLHEGPPISLYAMMSETIVCKSEKDLETKVTSLLKDDE